METQTIIFILLIVTLSILIITIYVWVFAIEPRQNNDKKNLSTLGLENLDTSAYLLHNVSNGDLLTFFEIPNKNDPFLDISYTFQNEPQNLNFDITNANGDSVFSSRKLLASKSGDNNNYKEERIFFKNAGINNDNYKIKYSLGNHVDNIKSIEIKKIELKV